VLVRHIYICSKFRKYGVTKKETGKISGNELRKERMKERANERETTEGRKEEDIKGG